MYFLSQTFVCVCVCVYELEIYLVETGDYIACHGFTVTFLFTILKFSTRCLREEPGLRKTVVKYYCQVDSVTIF